MKILAVDYGDSRTGLATCDRTEFLTTAITPQITLKARNKVAARVCEVARAPDHLRRCRPAGRERHLWHKAEGNSGLCERHGHSG